MLSKTHISIGTAASLAVTTPHNITEIITAIGIGALGSIICDIDATASEYHHKSGKITLFAIAIIMTFRACDVYFNTNIIYSVINNSSLFSITFGILSFIFICAYGRKQPHRSFMHSLLALVLLSFCTSIICPFVTPYFVTGYISHIVLDIMNMKKVRLFYPLKGGLCIHLCRADGIVNTVLFHTGCLFSVVEILLLLENIIF